MRCNAKVISEVKDGRVAEPRQERVGNGFHPDGEKLKVTGVFKSVPSQGSKAVASASVPPLPRSSYLLTGVLIIQAFLGALLRPPLEGVACWTLWARSAKI